MCYWQMRNGEIVLPVLAGCLLELEALSCACLEQSSHPGQQHHARVPCVKVAPGWIPAPALILYHQEQRADSERVSAALMPGHYYIWSFVAAHLYQMMEIYRFRQIYGQFGVVVEYLL